jgi:hypothetical protein
MLSRHAPAPDQPPRMSRVRAQRERTVPAKIERVWTFLRDYERNRPTILPDAYRDYRVESGGQGAGTVAAWTLAAGRRERPYRMEVDEPMAGRTLRERDTGSSLVTTWQLTPGGDGESTRVVLTTEWQGAGGVGGFFERTFAPAALGRVQDQVLERLEGAMRGAET